MVNKYVEELDELKRDFIEISDMARRIISEAMEALIERDAEKARSTYEYDKLIDLKELEIEEKCVRIFALYQPEASDLRFVVSILKSIGDLERVGDLARDICEIAIYLSEYPPIKPYVDLPRMAIIVKEMLKDAILSILKGDIEMAKEVIEKDDIVDSFYARITDELIEIVESDPKTAHIALRLILVTRSLERVGDHATNIAEYAVYMKTGEIIKHQKALKWLREQEEKKDDGGKE
ncbi:phosphate signaling complex protein PhoU [Desulfurobacterium indicum]|uniref:Phosphate-specific transport system accessory protein PhoU n=1 Tax=Desulfurobacterium indicum TaxID=1914305 RepID=A0A1R1MMX2_9BACT|nr:phosphate signaling complex protein PhoU [Desulfurobacterium indicum]OMH41171.1 phosphate transport system regulatory protein PhoU [Desulfurobacterium indicum]